MEQPVFVHLMHRGVGRSLDFAVGFGAFFDMKERIRAMPFADQRRHYLRSSTGQTWRLRELEAA